MEKSVLAPALAGPDIIGKAFPVDKIEIKAGRLGEVITSTIVPSIGLHACLIAAIVLYAQDRNMFGAMAPLFLFISLCVGVHIAVFGVSQNVITASRQATSLFGFVILSICASYTLLSASYDREVAKYAAGVLLICAFSIVLCMTWFKKIQPLGAVVISAYCVAFFRFFGDVDESLGVLIFAAMIISPLTYVVLKMQRYGVLVGTVFVGLLAIVLSSNDATGRGFVFLIYGFLLLVSLFFYELWANKEKTSDFSRFLAQGVGVVVVCFVVGLVARPGVTSLFLISAGLFSAYAFLAWIRGVRAGNAARLAWVAILLMGALLEYSDVQPALMAGTAGLLLISVICSSGFVRYVAGFTAAAGLWVSTEALVDRTESLFSYAARGDTGGAPTAAPMQIASVASASFFVFCLVVLALLVAMLPVTNSGSAWWHGLVRKRHAVVVRQIARSLHGKMSSIPMIGWIYGLTVSILSSIKYLKADGKPPTAFDLLQLAAFISAAIATDYLLRPLFFNYFLRGDVEPVDGWAKFFGILFGWALWGLLLAIWGSRRRSLFHTLLGFGFLCVPLASQLAGQKVVPTTENAEALWSIALMLWAGPVFLISLLPGRRSTAAAGPATPRTADRLGGRQRAS